MPTIRRAMGRTTTATAALLISGGAQAAGFSLVEQSVKGLGNAFAGAAAVAEDPSTVFWNPAGLTRLEDSRLNAGGYIIAPSSEFENQGSTAAPGTALQAPLSGGNGGDGGVTSPVANIYFSTPVNERMTFGLGINTPFGLETDYPGGWVGRYHAVESELRTINFNPSIGYAVNEQLSVGAGVSIQYADAVLTNKVDYGTLCLGSAAAGTCAANGVQSQQNDGSFGVSGDDIGFGANVGVLYEFTPHTRVGFHYRSQVEQELEGTADFDVDPTVEQVLGFGAGDPRFISRSVPAQASIDLPDTAALGGYTELGQWALMAGVRWTNWSTFDELRVEFGDGTADSVQPEEWDDSFRYSLGASYFLDSRWTLRGGVAYDETPIPSPELRTPRIPGNDRTWLTFGASYKHSDGLTFDVGYAHLFVDDTDINNTLPAGRGTGHTLTGEYDNSVDIFGVQAAWRF